MSTGPRTQAAFTQGSHSTTEHEASQSALFYLFQEVSKLATPIHSSFLDANSPSTWLNETSQKGPLMVNSEEVDAQSFQISNISCQHCLSCVSPYKQVESHSSKVSTLVEAYPEHNSPWRVLSLINLQCERLLHHSDVEESVPSSVVCATKSGYLIDSTSTSTADVTDQVGGDCISDECTLTPSILISETEDIPAHFSPVEDVSCSVRAGMKDHSQSQMTEKIDTVISGLVEKNAVLSSQPDHTDKKEDYSRFELNPECKKECISSGQDILNVPVARNALIKTQNSSTSADTLLTFNSNEHACVALSKPALALDQNANFALTLEPTCDNQLHPMSSVLPNSQSMSFLLSKFTTSKRECTQAPIEEICPPVVQLKSSSYNGRGNPSPSAPLQPEPKAEQKGDIIPPCTQGWRTKTPRKQPHPRRSVDIQDPDFQGVTFRMDTELDDSREQCRLLITSEYSKELCKTVRKPKLRTRTSQKSFKTSSSDEESDPTTSVSKGKVCASCCTRKTPMWRDAEDGTPLCNACGIRYKKYRVRCVNCWHIPRKEGNSNSCCLKCGNFVRLTSAQRKHTT